MYFRSLGRFRCLVRGVGVSQILLRWFAGCQWRIQWVEAQWVGGIALTLLHGVSQVHISEGCPEISAIDCLCSELSNNCERDGCRGPDCTASDRA